MAVPCRCYQCNTEININNGDCKCAERPSVLNDTDIARFKQQLAQIIRLCISLDIPNPLQIYKRENSNRNANLVGYREGVRAEMILDSSINTIVQGVLVKRDTVEIKLNGWEWFNWTWFRNIFPTPNPAPINNNNSIPPNNEATPRKRNRFLQSLRLPFFNWSSLPSREQQAPRNSNTRSICTRYSQPLRVKYFSSTESVLQIVSGSFSWRWQTFLDDIQSETAILLWHFYDERHLTNRLHPITGCYRSYSDYSPEEDERVEYQMDFRVGDFYGTGSRTSIRGLQETGFRYGAGVRIAAPRTVLWVGEGSINNDINNIGDDNGGFEVGGSRGDVGDLVFELRERSDISTVEKYMSKLKVMNMEGNGYGNAWCIICYEWERKKQLELECGHQYHDKCIMDWFRKKNNCPLCRKEVPL